LRRAPIYVRLYIDVVQRDEKKRRNVLICRLCDFAGAALSESAYEDSFHRRADFISDQFIVVDGGLSRV